MSTDRTKQKATKKESRKDSDPLEAVNTLDKKAPEAAGSNSGENNSDNSGIVSFGNTSFGFNFDSEEAMGNSSNNSNEDSDGNTKRKKQKTAPRTQSDDSSPDERKLPSINKAKSSVSSLTSDSNSNKRVSSIAGAAASLPSDSNAIEGDNRKRKADDNDSGSGGYNADDSDEAINPKAGERDRKTEAASSKSAAKISSSNSGASPGSKKRKQRKTDEKREERNAREKERSSRISKQINDLRALLSNGGVIVPKGTKSSVLSEAANYIRMLQQHQYRSELDRHQLIQQMQLIGSGTHGPQAAAAIRHVAAKNGVWSLGNFGGVPPKSAMSSFYNSHSNESSANSDQQSSDSEVLDPNKVDVPEYRFIFNSCGVGLAIASMGGAFVDCNQLFCQLSSYTKQELCALTIFNLTDKEDLQHAFDQISRLISPPMNSQMQEGQPVVLRGALKVRNDLGLSVSLVKGDDGVARCFCVTLVRQPSRSDPTAAVPATFDALVDSTAPILMQQQHTPQSRKSDEAAGEGVTANPAFTTG